MSYLKKEKTARFKPLSFGWHEVGSQPAGYGQLCRFFGVEWFHQDEKFVRKVFGAVTANPEKNAKREPKIHRCLLAENSHELDSGHQNSYRTILEASVSPEAASKREIQFQVAPH